MFEHFYKNVLCCCKKGDCDICRRLYVDGTRVIVGGKVLPIIPTDKTKVISSNEAVMSKVCEGFEDLEKISKELESNKPFEEVFYGERRKVENTYIVDKSEVVVTKDKDVVTEKLKELRTRIEIPCIHLGKIIDYQDCACTSKHIYECELYKKCRRNYTDGLIQGCLDCPNYEPDN